MMIGMDVMKLSRSQDGESWRGIGGSQRYGRQGGISAVFLHFSFSLSFWPAMDAIMPCPMATEQTSRSNRLIFEAAQC